MATHYYLNEDKTYRPAELMEWAMQFENIDRHVTQDIVEGHRISTVWLGLDHRLVGKGAPLLFETMIFDSKDGSDIYCERYSTWQEAEAGHQLAIEWVKRQ